RAVEPEAEASRALVDGAAVQLDAAVRVRLQADAVPERERRRRCVEHGRRLPRTRALEVVLVAGGRAQHQTRGQVAPCPAQRAVLGAQEEVARAELGGAHVGALLLAGGEIAED